MSDAPLFQLRDQQVSASGQLLLEVPALSIAAGERVALIGKSGSGKSTLLSLLRQQAREHCAYCPQQPGLVPPLSVYHNIYMGGLARHSTFGNLLNLLIPNRRERRTIGELCNELELDGKDLVSVDRLSGGQQQRTALGRALYQRAEIFLGDEPFSSVDPQHAERLLALVSAAHHTLVIALHDQQMALSHFSRVIGLKEGRILIDKAADAIQQSDLDLLYQD